MKTLLFNLKPVMPEVSAPCWPPREMKWERVLDFFLSCHRPLNRRKSACQGSSVFALLFCQRRLGREPGLQQSWRKPWISIFVYLYLSGVSAEVDGGRSLKGTAVPLSTPRCSANSSSELTFSLSNSSMLFHPRSHTHRHSHTQKKSAVLN